MPEVTLASIVEAAEKKYGDLVVPVDDSMTVTLRNALRLPKADRRALVKRQNELERIQNEEEPEEGSEPSDATSSGDDDQTDRMIENLHETIRLVADTKKGADALLAAIGDNIPALLELFGSYSDVSSPGEASPSES